ncbi:retrovirus-related pol polyprotein from transposon TNT 1-94 [Tanacetum coccineum]
MMLNSVLYGPLVYGTIEVDGVTRTKTYEDLTDQEKLQDDCDVRATNIVLQGLPPDVYSLVNHHHIAKEIWDRVKLLMQGTELLQQERECKLYNEFDRFNSVKAESLHEYYLRFAQLMNDMHTIGMTMQQVQVNNKFLNRNGGNNATVQARVVRCYNCQGDGHMARQCTQPNRPRNTTWFKEKILLVQAQESGQVLDEEQLAFLADP